MKDLFAHFITVHRPALEAALARWLPLGEQAATEPLNEALRYAVFPGGKRLRPLLTLIGARLGGGDVQRALPAACAVEYLHASSLILDDLPAMDDAEFRRGRPALHLVFGEGVALLAALALFNQAYALLARTAAQSGAPEITETLLAEAAHCIGADGMIGGQAVDLSRQAGGGAEAMPASRNLKTTALMRLTMTAGAIGCGAGKADVEALGRFGEQLGVAYQVCDDLLDELGDSESTGKTARQDARHSRASFVSELGVAGAYRLAMTLAEESKSALTARFGYCAEARMLINAVNLVIRDAGLLFPPAGAGCSHPGVSRMECSGVAQDHRPARHLPQVCFNLDPGA